MKRKATVLGCGLVGATMARDLATDGDFEVTALDVNSENLRRLEAAPNIRIRQADLGRPEKVKAAIEGCDIVVSGLPSVFGFQTLRAVIESGKPFCDISFMPEEALELDRLAKQHGVTAVVDCGVAPGLSNMIVGHVVGQLDRTDRVAIYVGGLPKARRWPFDYKAPFAPHDVLEEYTRPARLVEHGQVVVKPALSEPELMDFARVGTLEAFNTDGLRSLLTTLAVPDMTEKTLRYPGHVELIRVFREAGFFDKEEIEVGEVRVRPLDVTSKLLFPKWRYEEGEEEFTVLRVIVEGVKNDQPLRHTYDLYDEYDSQTGTSSMARTTGFPNVIMARMIANGQFDDFGVFPPELLVRREGLFDEMIGELDARGVMLSCAVSKIE